VTEAVPPEEPSSETEGTEHPEVEASTTDISSVEPASVADADVAADAGASET